MYERIRVIGFGAVIGVDSSVDSKKWRYSSLLYDKYSGKLFEHVIRSGALHTPTHTDIYTDIS